MKIFSTQQVQELENAHFSRQTDAPWQMMTSAGRAVFREALWMLRSQNHAYPLVWAYVGKGNNGGDALIALTHLLEHGIRTCAILCFDEKKQSHLARKALDLYKAQNGKVIHFAHQEIWGEPSLLIDGLLGSSSRGFAEGVVMEAIESINHHGLASLVLSVDFPSGLNPHTGAAAGPTVKSDLTLTLAWPKKALLTEEAQAFSGALEVYPLGFPDELTERLYSQELELWTRHSLINRLPFRSIHSHKGSQGHLFMLAGSERYPGAASLASEGALSSGCGLVSLLSSQDVLSLVPKDIITHALGADPLEQLQVLIARVQALVFGPGVGMACKERQDSILEFLWKQEIPLLLDADGLNLLSEMNLGIRMAPLILTPHPKEAARLLREEVSVILQDPPAAAFRISQKYRATVLLKGHHSVLALGDRLQIYPGGHPALARGGSGDILAGLWGGLMARGMDSWNAGRLAIWLHGRASHLCAWHFGPEGMRISDLTWGISNAWKELKNS